MTAAERKAALEIVHQQMRACRVCRLAARACCIMPGARLVASRAPPVARPDWRRNSRRLSARPVVGALPGSSTRVESIKVEAGDPIKQGDIIVNIDSELEQLTLQASRAATQQARAELTDAQRRFANAVRLRKQKSISQNEVDLREAEVQIKQAALQRLVAEGTVSLYAMAHRQAWRLSLDAGRTVAAREPSPGWFHEMSSMTVPRLLVISCGPAS